MPENRAGKAPPARFSGQVISPAAAAGSSASAGFCGLRQGIDHHGKTIVLPFRLTE
jgi:hypothetical protein